MLGQLYCPGIFFLPPLTPRCEADVAQYVSPSGNGENIELWPTSSSLATKLTALISIAQTSAGPWYMI